MIIVIIIITITVFSLLFRLLRIYKKIESFTNIFNIINLENNHIKKDTLYVSENLLVTETNINKILQNISTASPSAPYYEIKNEPIKLEPYLNIVETFYIKLKRKFENDVKIYNKKICNKGLNCAIELLEKRILRIGKSKHKKHTCIEGQLLLKFNVSSYIFLVHFVITDNHYEEILYLKLKSISHFQNYSVIKNIIRDDIELSPYIIPPETKYYTNTSNYTLIDDIINQPVKKIRTKKEIQGIVNTVYSKIENKRNDKKFDKKYDFRCYGKEAINKYQCSNIYNTFGNTNHSGIWDRKCIKNEECPFYKKNLNYTNDFGGCINGSCDMPLGLTNISPHHYNKNDIAICHNCKKGVYCCDKQNNKKEYPNLISPDYAFEEDSKIRK